MMRWNPGYLLKSFLLYHDLINEHTWFFLDTAAVRFGPKRMEKNEIKRNVSFFISTSYCRPHVTIPFNSIMNTKFPLINFSQLLSSSPSHKRMKMLCSAIDVWCSRFGIAFQHSQRGQSIFDVAFWYLYPFCFTIFFKTFNVRSIFRYFVKLLENKKSNATF